MNAAFAAAIATGLGVPAGSIAEGLARFRPDLKWSPGRVNLIDAGRVCILLDYAHNADAVAALMAFVQEIPVRGRRLLLLCAPGNRVDSHFDAIAAAAAAGDRFLHYVCSTELPRGRPRGETSRLIAQGLARHGVDNARIEAIEPIGQAIGTLLRMAQPEDLLVMACDPPERVLNHPEFRALAARHP